MHFYLAIVSTLLFVASGTLVATLHKRFRNKQRHNTTSPQKAFKIVYFHVKKQSENPFLDETTSLSVYDSDEEVFLKCENVHDNLSFEEFSTIFKAVIEEHKHLVYFVTYDMDFRKVCFKNIMEDFIDTNRINAKFVDIKRLFYYVHPLVQKIKYQDLLDYYKVPNLQCRSLEYCAIFDQIIQDFDPNIKEDMNKFHLLFNHLHN